MRDPGCFFRYSDRRGQKAGRSFAGIRDGKNQTPCFLLAQSNMVARVAFTRVSYLKADIRFVGVYLNLILMRLADFLLFDCIPYARMKIPMDNLVENLLSVSRLEEGRMNLHVSTELIDEVVAEALRHINRKSAAYRLHVQNSEEYLLAQIDAKLIGQVIINIVDNAVKYTPPGSEIHIGWERKGSYIYISIADNGPGIPDQAKPHIFDMFYSASNQIADSRRSLGLGLALCKSIVNAHGGEIMVADQLPHGSIFTFSVPAGEVKLHE